MLLLGLFLFYQSITRSAFVQNVILSTLGLFLYSFWIPQIIRNVWRGCRRPLSHRYILTMSITRLSVPLCKFFFCIILDITYLITTRIDFYGCPDNLIGHETTPWVWAVVAYVVLQIIILFLQDAFGPRLFVPSKVSRKTLIITTQSNTLFFLVSSADV